MGRTSKLTSDLDRLAVLVHRTGELFTQLERIKQSDEVKHIHRAPSHGLELAYGEVAVNKIAGAAEVNPNSSPEYSGDQSRKNLTQSYDNLTKSAANHAKAVTRLMSTGVNAADFIDAVQNARYAFDDVVLSRQQFLAALMNL